MTSVSYTVEAVELTAEFTAQTPAAEIPVSLPLTRFAVVWAMNEIPRAELAVAAGRNMQDLKEDSPVHTFFIDQLDERTEVLVYAKVTTRSRQNAPWLEKWPAGRFLVFRGISTGKSWQSSTDGNVEFTVVLDHWLVKLTGASAVSATFHPSNPSAYTFAPVLRQGGGGGAPDAPALVEQAVAEKFVTAGTLTTDLWAGGLTGGGGNDIIFGDAGGQTTGTGILGFLRALTAGEDVFSPAFTQLPGLDPQGPNKDARAALDKFEPAAGGYQCGVPLKLDVGNAPELDAAARMIAADIANDGPLTMANATVWDQLLKYAQSYLFSIVPLVDKALVVPFIPCLSKAYKTIKREEYDVGAKATEAYNLVRGVGVYGGYEFQAGADQEAGEGVNYNELGIGGYYVDPGRPTGTLRLVQGPPWTNQIPYHVYTDGTLGGGGAQPVPTAVDPGVPFVAGAGAAAVEPAKAVKSQAGFMTKLAQAIYASEAVRGRSVDLHGRLRFDLAPGSTVRVEGASEAFLGQDVQGEAFFGTVRSVSIVLDAEAGEVGTALHVGDLRSTAEAERPGSALTFPKHPLWADPWYGAPLIAEIPCGTGGDIIFGQ